MGFLGLQKRNGTALEHKPVRRNVIRHYHCSKHKEPLQQLFCETLIVGAPTHKRTTRTTNRIRSKGSCCGRQDRHRGLADPVPHKEQEPDAVLGVSFRQRYITLKRSHRILKGLGNAQNRIFESIRCWGSHHPEVKLRQEFAHLSEETA